MIRQNERERRGMEKIIDVSYRVCPIESFWDELEEMIDGVTSEKIRDHDGQIKINIEFIDKGLDD